jgi:hypothetical protein
LIALRETTPEPLSEGAKQPQSSFARWVLPSISDVFFLVLVILLGFSPLSQALLRDADTGWHIRNGEFILASHSVPRVDDFSYTRAGQPWYAWEWLYDAVIAAIHHVAGLNGVVLFNAVIIAATFALLFRFILRRSGNFVVSTGLTLLAASAAQIHILARPHVLSWLFTLLWVETLYRFKEGENGALLWLPPMMLLWVNVHGGFILGLVLLALFGFSIGWNYLICPTSEALRQMARLGAVFAVCLALTFLNPYGYRLHVHVYQYLSNSFFMNSIAEFMSPNFHAPGMGYFEVLILLCVLGIAGARERIALTDLLILLFSIHAGLYSGRNIPISAILMSQCMGPLWAGTISNLRLAGSYPDSYPGWLRSLLGIVHGISEDMGRLESQFRGHGLAVVALIAAVAIAANGGKVLSTPVLSAHFDPSDFPVKATEFIARQGIRDHLFSPDRWGGYLIYKLYPGTKLYFDDRHDFYGEAFVREYLKAENGTRQWREPLDKYQVRWVLVPTDSSLSNVMKESRDWHVEYDDGVAIVFAR